MYVLVAREVGILLGVLTSFVSVGWTELSSYFGRWDWAAGRGGKGMEWNGGGWVAYRWCLVAPEIRIFMNENPLPPRHVGRCS